MEKQINSFMWKQVSDKINFKSLQNTCAQMKHWNLTTLLLKQKYKNLNIKIIITLPSLFLISKMLIISSRPKNQIQPNTNSGLVSFSILQPTNLIFQTKKEKKSLFDPFQNVSV